MERWLTSLQSALKHSVAQGILACALLVPLVATAGQYWSSGFWWQWTGVELLFWPGQTWHWVVRMPVSLSMGAMLGAYLVGIAWLLHKRTLSMVVVSAVVGLIVANLAAAAMNSVAGWRELQSVSSMDLAGRANRAVFSLWHNPVWEEIVFRGLPLVLLLFVRRSFPGSARWSLWGYYLLPALACAAYHVPGHGPSRLIDTFFLSLVFSWMTLRYTFFAPLVMHCIFDAVMTMSLSKIPSIPAAEVAWLGDHFTLLNSTWSITLLLWLASIPLAVFVRRYRLARSSAPVVAN